MAAYRADRINCRIPIEIGRWTDYLALSLSFSPLSRESRLAFAPNREMQIDQLRAQRAHRRHRAWRYLAFWTSQFTDRDTCLTLEELRRKITGNLKKSNILRYASLL